MSSISGNLIKIKSAVSAAALKAGNDGKEITLCAVTKTRTADEINEAINAGITDIGENKVQEIMDKYEHIFPVRWHMVGHLQTNKVKYIIDKVDLIHSVDSIKLAHEIDKRAGQHGKIMDVLIQMNPAKEESKFGISEEETGVLIKEILDSCRNIRIKGLMCVTPLEDDPKDTAMYFAAVKKLYDKYSKEIKNERLDFEVLSMGMSNDFEVAIAEGSNFVRIGTALFGERNYNKTGG